MICSHLEAVNRNRDEKRRQEQERKIENKQFMHTYNNYLCVTCNTETEHASLKGTLIWRFERFSCGVFSPFPSNFRISFSFFPTFSRGFDIFHLRVARILFFAESSEFSSYSVGQKIVCERNILHPENANVCCVVCVCTTCTLCIRTNDGQMAKNDSIKLKKRWQRRAKPTTKSI